MLYCIVSSYTSTSGIVLCCIILYYRKLQPAVSTNDLAPIFLEEFNENVFSLGQEVMGEEGGNGEREG